MVGTLLLAFVRTVLRFLTVNNPYLQATIQRDALLRKNRLIELYCATLTGAHGRVQQVGSHISDVAKLWGNVRYMH